MKWSELKDFCDTLEEWQLEKDVILWREDEAVSRIAAEKLSEPHYIDPDEFEEGCYPLSEAARPEDELKMVYDAGHPILWEDFTNDNKTKTDGNEQS